MPSTYNIGDNIYYHFTIYAADEETPLSGEVQADFTFTLFRGTTQIAIPPVSVGECGSTGTYYALIIPTQTGTYHFRIIGDNDNVRVWHTFDFEVTDELGGLYIIESILKNKLTISEVSGTYYQQVWNDAGTSVILQWQLYDKDNLDVVLTGRGPASRGVPSGT